MNSNLLVSIAGVLIALVFEYAPWIKDRFNAQTDTAQRLIMLGVLLVAALVAFGLACAHSFTVPGIDVSSVSCDQQGATGLVNLFIAAAVSNQATYLLLPKKS